MWNMEESKRYKIKSERAVSFGYYDEAVGRFTACVDMTGLGTTDALLFVDRDGTAVLAGEPDLTCELPGFKWTMVNVIALLDANEFTLLT